MTPIDNAIATVVRTINRGNSDFEVHRRLMERFREWYFPEDMDVGRLRPIIDAYTSREYGELKEIAETARDHTPQKLAAEIMMMWVFEMHDDLDEAEKWRQSALETADAINAGVVSNPLEQHEPRSRT